MNSTARGIITGVVDKIYHIDSHGVSDVALRGGITLRVGGLATSVFLHRSAALRPEKVGTFDRRHEYGAVRNGRAVTCYEYTHPVPVSFRVEEGKVAGWRISEGINVLREALELPHMSPKEMTFRYE